jgi:hypothetical protein
MRARAADRFAPAVIVPFDSTEAGIAQLRDRVMGAVASMRDERVASLPGLSHSPPSFSAYQAYDIGSDHFVAQRYAESLASFRDAFARDTTFTLSLLMAARAAWNVGDYAVAESLVARARLATARSRDVPRVVDVTSRRCWPATARRRCRDPAGGGGGATPRRLRLRSGLSLAHACRAPG